MSRPEIKKYVTTMVKRINAETDIGARYEAKEALIERLWKALNGVDYISYEDGYVYNRYINFDSNCGLSIIQNTTDLEHIIEAAKTSGKSLDELAFKDVVLLFNDICDRREDWKDLINEDYTFDYTPEEFAESVLSIADDWVGEDKFKEDIRKYTSMNTLNDVWKYLCKGKPGNGTCLSQFYVSNPNEVAQAFWNGVLTVLEIENKITSEQGTKIWNELNGRK